MDVQGAELMALKGLGQKIHNVNIVQSEVEFIEIYKEQPLFNEIKGFLELHGFKFVGFNSVSGFSADAIFIREELVNEIVMMICKDKLTSPSFSLLLKRFFVKIYTYLRKRIKNKNYG